MSRLADQDPTQPEYDLISPAAKGFYMGYIKMVGEVVFPSTRGVALATGLSKLQVRDQLTRQLVAVVKAAESELFGDFHADIDEKKKLELITYCDLASRMVLHEETSNDMKQLDPAFTRLRCPINEHTIDKIEAYARTHKDALTYEELMPDFFGPTAARAR